MKTHFIGLLFVLAFCFYSAQAQCCCSRVHFSFVDDDGKSIPASKLRILDLTVGVKSSRVYPDKSGDAKKDFIFRIGCATGNDVIAVAYEDAEMKIHFKLSGEFGEPAAEFTFGKGDFIAEQEKSTRLGDPGAVKIRKATAEDLETTGTP